MFTFANRGRAPPATAVPLSPVAAVGEPTPLLVHLAGDFASRVAGLWEAPHTPFVTATAERRHLVCAAFAYARGGSLGATPRALLDLPLKQALAMAIPAAPEGLRRALSHMGERAWSAKDYDRLLLVLRLGAAGSKDVRHAGVLTPRLIRALAALPAPVLSARVGGFGLSEAQARLLAEAFGVIVARDGQEAAGAAAQRWAGARNAEGLFALVEDDLTPPMPEPPFAATRRLRPITTKADIREAAARYRNCLRTRIPSVCAGEAAIYEWTGGPPVVIEIARDPIYGWHLVEAKGPRNNAVPKALRGAIVEDLKAMGVHVGRNTWGMRYALEQAHQPDFAYAEPDSDIDWMFE